MGMQMTGSNGIFSVPSEHLPGLIALVAFPLVAWCVIAAIRAGANRGYRSAVALDARLDSLSFAGRVTLVAMLVGAVVHAAIIPTHWGDSRVLALLFVADVIGFLVVSVWLVLQRPHWRLAAIAMLGGFDISPWADRVQMIDAEYVGVWELPVLGAVTAPAAVLIRPDGYIAWVGDGTDTGLRDALTTWFGTP